MRSFYLIIMAFLFANASNAQITNIAEPEFSGNIIYVNESNGLGVKLEKQTASFSTKVNGATYVPIVGLFAGKATAKGVVRGASSPVQIDKKSKVFFIARVSDNSADPTAVFYIYKLTPEKESRTIKLASGKIGSSESGGIKYLDFTGKKYGQSSYLLEIENLDVGEYAIELADKNAVLNMFGIK